MGILDKVLGKDKDLEPEATPRVPEVEAAECPHTAMTPHWDKLDDMGKDQLATYTCEACGQTFSYEQAHQFMDQPPAVLTGHAPQPYEDEHSR